MNGAPAMYDRKTAMSIAAALFIMLYISYCYFLQNPYNWNSVPRIALALSVIENGTLDITEYKPATADIAIYKGKLYSDKAPGMSFMAIPFIAVARLIIVSNFEDVKWVRWRGEITPYFALLMQVANMFTTALITVLTALTIYYLALRLGTGLAGAVFGALAYGLATPAWGWATAFFSHNPTGGFLFMGFAAVYCLTVLQLSERKEALLSFTAGALLSWSVVIEFTSAPAAAIIAVYGICCARSWERRRLLRVLLFAASGALVFISPLLIYNYMITGSISGSLYKYTVFYSGMRRGFFGLSYPHPTLLVKLLFTGGHGLFWLSPILLMAPYALYRLWRTPDFKAVAAVLTAVPLYYLLLNSSYEYWTGGGSTGPRFLTPMLPFLCLPLALIWAGAGKRLRGVLLGLFTLSFLISLACVSFSMTKEIDRDINILTEYIIPGFLSGEGFQINVFRVFLHPSLEPYLTGQTALLPLYAVLASCGAYIVLKLKKAKARV